MAQANVLPLLRRTGWLKLFRDPRSFEEGRAAAEAIKPFGLHVDFLDAAALRDIEPALREGIGAVHYLDPASLSDPQALTLGYLKLFEARGGRFFTGDAATLRPAPTAMASKPPRGRCSPARRCCVSAPGPTSRWRGSDTQKFRSR